jgi:hypothetical protein
MCQYARHKETSLQPRQHLCQTIFCMELEWEPSVRGGKEANLRGMALWLARIGSPCPVLALPGYQPTGQKVRPEGRIYMLFLTTIRQRL